MFDWDTDITDGMFHDPEWMHGDSDLMGDDNEPRQEEMDTVLDGERDAAAAAVAAGFGYHLASDSLEERKIAEDILKRKEEGAGKIEKIPLKKRKGVAIKGSPAKRWMFEVATGQKSTKDPVEYTEEEKKQILQHEGEHDFEP